MDPIDFPDANVTLQAPAGMPDVNPLRVKRAGGVVESRWKPSASELLTLVDGGSVVLQVWGDTQPPVLLDVAPPED